MQQIIVYQAPFTLLRFCLYPFLLHRSYPFTLLRFCIKAERKPPFLCVHIDLERFQKRPFLWISTFDTVFENLSFRDVFVRISVNTFTKTEVFLSVFVQKRSNVNRASIYELAWHVEGLSFDNVWTLKTSYF